MATCSDKTYLEWYRAANQVFHVGFGTHSELLKGGTNLDEDGNTPTVELHELTVEHPETWVDVSSKVSISQIVVVDDTDEDGEVIMANGAVQFRLAADTGADLKSGDIYSFWVMADRADDPTLQVAARVWVRIMPYPLT
jgi:hypothetical protein